MPVLPGDLAAKELLGFVRYVVCATSVTMGHKFDVLRAQGIGCVAKPFKDAQLLKALEAFIAEGADRERTLT
jgi:hypothetical protein